MMIETFECEDNYEAEKLAGLLAVQKDNSIYVSKISGVIKNEIIIMLKDRSSISDCTCKSYSSEATIATQ